MALPAVGRDLPALCAWLRDEAIDKGIALTIRGIDPIRQWKLSEVDVALLGKWDEYTAAKVMMFRRSHTPEAPRTVVRSNDNKRARLEATRSLLAQLDYDEDGLPPTPIAREGS